MATALFLSPVVSGLYGGLGRGLPEAFPILSTLFLATSVCAWFWDYSHRYRIPWVMDMGWFLFAAWVLLIPYYILRAEGRRGLGRIGLFCLTYFAAWACGWATQVWTRLAFGPG